MNQSNTIVLNSVPLLVVICGATATGKSGLAMEIARQRSAAILSADSRQVYREFNIGTAKPNWSDRYQVPHYLIDICEPTETVTLADYQTQAQTLIAHYQDCLSPGPIASSLSCPASSASAQPVLPLLVGGTGLYIKAIVRGLKIPRVAPQPDLRRQFQQMGQPLCHQWLQQVDPIAAQRIHANDQVRTLRALEVFYVTGCPISQQQGEHPPPYPILQIGLDCTDDRLQQRITQRIAQMMAEGLVEEVETLCQRYGSDLPLLDTLGYREVKQYLQGDLSRSEAEAAIGLHTRQFAKQQRTWFRSDRSIVWFDADAPDLVDQVLQRIQQFQAQCEANVKSA